jgi:hypothetical protein
MISFRTVCRWLQPLRYPLLSHSISRYGYFFCRSASQGDWQDASCLLWAIALVPGPFIYLWGWFLGLGQTLLTSPPVVYAQITSECQANIPCSDNFARDLALFVDNTLSFPIRGFKFPPVLDQAALAFAVLSSIALLFSKAGFGANGSFAVGQAAH